MEKGKKKVDDGRKKEEEEEVGGEEKKGRVRIELCHILQYDPGKQRAITTL